MFLKSWQIMFSVATGPAVCGNVAVINVIMWSTAGVHQNSLMTTFMEFLLLVDAASC